MNSQECSIESALLMPDSLPVRIERPPSEIGFAQDIDLTG
jgi:hypothetical protein